MLCIIVCLATYITYYCVFHIKYVCLDNGVCLCICAHIYLSFYLPVYHLHMYVHTSTDNSMNNCILCGWSLLEFCNMAVLPQAPSDNSFIKTTATTTRPIPFSCLSKYACFPYAGSRLIQAASSLILTMSWSE